MLDRKQIGRTLPRQKRIVEAGRLRFFLEVIGDKAGAYADRDQGSGRLRVPPTYLFCLEMMDDPDPLQWLKNIGADLLHILHGEQRFDYRGMAFVGDTLTFDPSIADIYEKKGGALEFVVKKTEVRNQTDVHIATLTSTVVCRNPAKVK